MTSHWQIGVRVGCVICSLGIAKTIGNNFFCTTFKVSHQLNRAISLVSNYRFGSSTFPIQKQKLFNWTKSTQTHFSSELHPYFLFSKTWVYRSRSAFYRNFRLADTFESIERHKRTKLSALLPKCIPMFFALIYCLSRQLH